MKVNALVLKHGISSPSTPLLAGFSRVVLVVVVVLVVSLRTVNYISVLNQEVSYYESKVGESVVLNGVVSYDIGFEQEYTRYYIKHGGLNTEIRLDLNRILNAGSRCRVEGVLSKKKRELNLYQADRVFFVRYPDISCSRDAQLLTVPALVVDKVELYFAGVLSFESLSLAIGLVTGADRYFSSSTESVIRASGTSHIIAASGSNVNFFTKIIAKLFSLFPGFSYFYGFVLVLLLVFLYLVSGLSSSLLRALVMYLLVIMLRKLGLKVGFIPLVLLVLVFSHLISPFVFLSIGFQMSMLCVLAIRLYASLSSKFKFFSKFESFWISLFCSVAVLPVTLYYFGSASMVGVVFNILVLFLFDVSLPLLLFVVFFSALGMGLFSDYLLLVFEVISEYYFYIIGFAGV